MRVRSLCVGAALAALVSSACGSDDVTRPPRTEPTPVASALPSVATIPPATEPAGPSSADDAALGLYRSWIDGDEAAATAFATPQAVNELFAHQASEIQFNSCSRNGSKYRCFFYYEGGGLNMDVEGSVTTGYRVTKAFFIAD